MYLSDDLTAEILSRLPLQPLVRFKTACKSWNTIISSPSFAKLHLNNYGSNNNFLLLAFDKTTRKWKLSLTTFGISSSELATRIPRGVAGDYVLELPTMMECSTPQKLFKDKIVGPFNGFICIYGTNVVSQIALCNPNLQTIETLPECPIPSDDICMGECRIPSDDVCMRAHYTTRAMGLGQDFVTGETKVVQILSYLCYKFDHRIWIGIRRVDMYIYSPSTKTWRLVLDYDATHYDASAISHRFFVKKAIGSYKDGSFAHWLNDRQSVILSFDMRKEVLVITPLPIRYNRKQTKIKIFTKDSSSLVLFAYPRKQVSDENCVFDRWELSGLGEKGRHWSRLTRVGPFLGVSKPVGALWESYLLVVREGNKLVFYDYSTRRVRRIYQLEEKNSQFNCHDFIKVLEYKGSPF